VERSRYDMYFKTVEIAVEKEIIKSKAIIVDATHTKARYNQKSPKKALMEKSRILRKMIYEIDEMMKLKFPPKTQTDVLEDELDYCQKLIHVINQQEAIREYPKVKEKLNLLKKTVEDVKSSFTGFGAAIETNQR
jgi:hypothetical protein